MSRKKKGLVWAALGFAILWVSLVLAVPSTSQADGGMGSRDVRVINTSAEPVPVTGTVNVGTLQPVAVSSLPPVAVATLPAVQLSGPIVVRDPESNRTPFLHATVLSLSDGQSFSQTEMFTVPQGKRLVLECVSFKVSVYSQSTGVDVFCNLDGSPTYAWIPVPLSKQGSTGPYDVYSGVINPSLRMISGAQMSLVFRRLGDLQPTIGNVTFMGYLVDMP
jgi:hypothetical protein